MMFNRDGDTVMMVMILKKVMTTQGGNVALMVTMVEMVSVVHGDGVGEDGNCAERGS